MKRREFIKRTGAASAVFSIAHSNSSSTKDFALTQAVTMTFPWFSNHPDE